MKHVVIVAAFLFLVSCEPEDPWSGDPDLFENDDDYNQAKEQRVGTARSARTFCPDGDSDWIRFRVTEVDLDITADPASDPYGPRYLMQAVDFVGTPVLELGTDRTFKGWGSPWLVYAPPEPGIYYLHLIEGHGEGGEYRLEIRLVQRRQSDLALPHPDLIVSKVSVDAEVSEGTTVPVAIDIANIGDEDVVGDFTLSLYASQGRVLDTDNVDLLGETTVTDLPSIINYKKTVTIDADFSQVTAVNGPIYVIAQVDSGDAFGGEYEDYSGGRYDSSNNMRVASTYIVPADLNMVDGNESNEDGPNATDWSVADLTDLTFHIADDEDWFKFTVPAGPPDTVRYEIWTDNLRGDANTKLELLADDFVTPIDADEDGGCENRASYVTALLDADTTYYVRVTNQWDGSGAYDLNMRVGDSDSSFDDDYEPDDYDEHDTVRPWHTIIPEERLYRSLVTSTDVDWIVYAVSKNGHQKAHTIRTDEVGCDTKLELFNSTGESVSEGEAGTDPGEWKIAATLSAGLYYVKITAGASFSNPGRYELVADAVSP